MKICIATDFFPPRRGGVETHTYSLARALVEMGEEVHVITGRYRGERSAYQDGIYIHRPHSWTTKRGVMISPHTWYLISYLMKKHRFDVVHGEGLFSPASLASVTIADFRSVPTVLTCHSLHPRKKTRNPFFYITNRLIKAAIEHTQRIITVSEDSRGNWGFEKAAVIPNGVDLRRIDSIEPIDDLEGSFRICCAARLHAHKGIEFAIDALGQRKDVDLYVIGEGPDKKKLARRCGKNTHFIGGLPWEETIAYIKSADLFLIPSTREASSMALLEAWACRTPTLISDLPALRELADESTSLFFSPLGASELNERITEAIEDNEKLKRISDNAYKRASESFTIDKMAEAHMDLYHSL